MTYSILARDSQTGEMGVATQSQALAVGSSVPWAMAGHGVIATQSMGEPAYGQLGLQMMADGLTAPEALTALRSVDPHPERRQVAMIDSRGEIALYTGQACLDAAGELVGDGCCAVANMVASASVWQAMVHDFASTTGSLAARLLAALHAAEEQGGDIRGRRSAAIVVVRAQCSGRPWRDTVVDHRIDDHPDPVTELDKIVEHSTRYHRMVTAFEAALDGRADAAAEDIDTMPLEDPTVDADMLMWRAIILALAGRERDAATLFATLHRHSPGFVDIARQFRDAGVTPASALLDQVLAES